MSFEQTAKHLLRITALIPDQQIGSSEILNVQHRLKRFSFRKISTSDIASARNVGSRYKTVSAPRVLDSPGRECKSGPGRGLRETRRPRHADLLASRKFGPTDHGL